MTKTLYFTANTAALGTELWRVDAAGNVTLVKDFTPGPANTSFGEMIAFNGELYFDVLNGSHFDLWKVGADGNAVLVTGPDGGVMQGVQNPAIANGKLYFGANGPTGVEPYVIGPDGVVHLVADLAPGSGGSWPSQFTALGDDIYFKAATPGTGGELWKLTSDGTVTVVPELVAGTGGSDPGNLFAFADTLYFSASRSTTGYEVYKLRPDGTPVLARDIAPHGVSSDPGVFTFFDRALYFRANDGTTGAELWKVTSGGTVTRVTDIYPGVGGTDPAEMTVFNDSLYFAASSGPTQRELWRLSEDGTLAQVSWINSADLANVDDLTVFRGALYFTAYESQHGTELWRMTGDGTVSLVADIEPGLSDSQPTSLVVSGNSMYFTAWTSLHGSELWRVNADGAVSRVTDLMAGPDSSVYLLLKAAVVSTPDIAPIITSNGGGDTAQVLVAENTTAVTTVTAVDDLSGVNFSLSGADANRFTLGASGELTFQSAPDFEFPADQGGNNVYNIVLTATDIDGITDTQALAIAVTDVKGISYGGTKGNNNKTGTLEADLLKGQAGNDTLKGGGGKDTIEGGDGKDKLSGGERNDKLTGGAGKDKFVFDTPLATAGVDKITDFNHADDTIVLDGDVFTTLGGGVASVEFLVRAHGHAATKDSHHLIYDKSNGSLWYDADGKGAETAIKIAQLGTAAHHPTNLSYDDFAIV